MQLGSSQIILSKRTFAMVVISQPSSKMKGISMALLILTMPLTRLGGARRRPLAGGARAELASGALDSGVVVL